MRIGIAVLFAVAAVAQDNPGDFFEKQVRPVIAENCQSCHNPKSQRAGLDLTTGQGFYAGADSGVLIDSANLADSRILKAIGYHDRVKMPPTGKLKDTDIEKIRTWVMAGADWPGVDKSSVAALKAPEDRKITEGQKRFWSFQPLKTAAPPEVSSSEWSKNPIDAFVFAKLQAKKMSPAPPAGKMTLLRRATFDLTGLPPTAQEIEAFLADNSANAFEKVVDRLLASPHYGERWGRHWLDVARYADSTGADEDHRYPDAWRYRDYVINSFNDDVPYDRFVKEQLAGDMMPPEGEDAKIGVNRRGLIATGFLAIGPRLIAEQDKKKMYYDFVDEQIATTTRAFLGLTVDCARCHDHKFDPISQKDYYSLASIFASTKSFAKLEGTVSQMYRPPLVPKHVFNEWDTHQKKLAGTKRGVEMIDREQARLRVSGLVARLPEYMVASRGGSEEGLDAALLAKWKEYLKPGVDVRPYLSRWEKADDAAALQVAESYRAEFEDSGKDYQIALNKWRKAVEKANIEGLPGPDKPTFDVSRHRFFEDVYLDKKGPFAPPENFEKTFPADVLAKREALNAEVAELQKTSPPQPDLAIGVEEGDTVTQHLFVRGDAHSEGEFVPKQFPVVLAGGDQTPVTSGSGRKELAEWLTDPKHPLVPRVMVNRIWQGHFGEGLVRTPSNFGLLGEKPTHPALLDWLAHRFIEDGWSIKKLHRRILLSKTYQQSSQITKEKSEADPDNRMLARFERRRLDVEEIRDAMLAIDGTIDFAMGGTLQEGSGTDGENSSKRMSIDPATSKRRTVYIPLRRSNLPSLLNLFDFGDATTTGEGRARTNVAPQALFAMNSPFINRAASTLAEKSAQQPADAAIRQGYLRVLNRSATNPEVTGMTEYMNGFPDEAEFARRRSLFRLLLASNEFFYVD